MYLCVASLATGEMSLERFGFLPSGPARPATSPASATGNASCSEALSVSGASSTPPPEKKRRFNTSWREGREWLKYDADEGTMFCVWCRRFRRSDVRNQFVSGCASMKLESIKKHEQSQTHRDAAGAQRAQVRPDRAPMEVALQSMEREELAQMKRLFNTAFYLVSAERPFRDFPELLRLQRMNGVPLGQAYGNAVQARTFVHFIAEEIRSDLVLLLRKSSFFSVCMDSSTDKATIDEEMVQIRVLKDNIPVYRL